MYKDIETETSYKYLKTVTSKLKVPICILGGWAVFFTVNANYKMQTGRVYIGSRDIDLGFNSVSSLKQATNTLEKELNFRFVSFRYYKNIHAETGKDLSEEEVAAMPQHMYFPIYVDPIMSYSDRMLKAKLGFAPIDEPLLKHVFEKKYCSTLVKEFGRELLLPSPEILLATKINAVVSRDKEHKRYKDICDITALCLFSGLGADELIKNSRRFMAKDSIKKFIDIGFEQDISNCSNALGLEKNTVKSLIEKIKERK